MQKLAEYLYIYCQKLQIDIFIGAANTEIGVSEVVSNLTTIVVTPPENEAQTRPLISLEPDEQRLAWEVVQQTAPAGKIGIK